MTSLHCSATGRMDCFTQRHRSQTSASLPPVCCWIEVNTVVGSILLCRNALSNTIQQDFPFAVFLCPLQCSKSCGAGHRRRALQCVDNNQQQVHEMYCVNQIRPPDLESCNTHSCESTWITGEWTEVRTREAVTYSHHRPLRSQLFPMHSKRVTL